MKIRLFTFLISIIALSISLSAQDTIPNGGFEQWTQGGAIFFDPDGWRTPDPFTSAINVIVTSPDSVTVHSGHFSAQLRTKTGAGYTIPGLVTTGILNPTTQNIESGIPIHSRPVSLKGWYQYTPAGSDTAAVSISLFSTSGQTIGSGSLDISAATSGWTSFTVPISYVSSAIPDTSQVNINSSNYHGSIGSILMIDDVNYSYDPLGIDEKESVQVIVSPNPASQLISVSFDGGKGGDTEIKLSDINGKLLQILYSEKTFSGSFNRTFNLSEFPCGMYLLQMTCGSKRAVQRIIVD